MKEKTEAQEVSVVSKNEINQLVTGIPTDRAKQLRETFVPIIDLLESYENDYNDIMGQTDIYTPKLAKDSRKLRLKYAKVRTSADKAHKEVKADLLLQTKAIDGMRNIIKYASSDKEKQLAEIENYIENQRKIEIAAKQEDREKCLSEYGYEQFPPNLGEMNDEAWEIFFLGARENYKKKAEAEEKARILKERKEAILPYRVFVKDFESIDLQAMSDKDFDKMLTTAKESMSKQEEERKKLEEEKKRLEQERIEAERRAKEELERRLQKQEEEAKMHRKMISQRVSTLKHVSFNGEDVVSEHTGKVITTSDKVGKMTEEKFAEFAEKHNKKAIEEQRKIDDKLEQDRIQAETEKKKLEDARLKMEQEVKRLEEMNRQNKVAERPVNTGSDKEKLLSLSEQFKSPDMPTFNTSEGKDAERRIRTYLKNLSEKVDLLAKSIGEKEIF